VLGGRLLERNISSREREVTLGCLVLNKMFELGKARSYTVTG
jgi:hypothetical protein